MTAGAGLSHGHHDERCVIVKIAVAETRNILQNSALDGACAQTSRSQGGGRHSFHAELLVGFVNRLCYTVRGQHEAIARL